MAATVTKIRVETKAMVFFLSLVVCAAQLRAQRGESHTHQLGIDVLDYDFTLDLPDSGQNMLGDAVLIVPHRQPVPSVRLDLIALRAAEYGGEVGNEGVIGSDERDAGGRSTTTSRT